MTTGLVYGSGAEDDVMGCEETVFVFHVTWMTEFDASSFAG